MAEEETITVRITLRKHVGEKLRALCHARGETASLVVDRWVIQADERGDIGGKKKDDPIEQMLRKLGLG